MNDKQLIASVGYAIDGRQWQTPLAERLGVSTALIKGLIKGEGRTISRKLAGKLHVLVREERPRAMEALAGLLRLLQETETKFPPVVAADKSVV